jgi:histidyl-tRNA synthetase
MPSKPTIPKGTRDFSAEEMQRREYIFDTIKKIFRLYGYQPIETPAMENLSSLLGKYGEDGDKLLFRILNSGDYLSNVTDTDLELRDTVKLSSKICEKGLRYDLTVPFARFVTQHRDEIIFPFKRYQIQPVWRADRPQKGRYREFFQCDADVIGSNSLLNEYELLRIIDEIFVNLGLSIIIKINNRKILSGIAEYIGENSKITDITVAIDKIEKIGIDAVNDELRTRGLSCDAIEKLQPILLLKGSNEEKLYAIETLLAQSEIGIKGVDELKTIFGYVATANVKAEIELDLTLARGLNYYTGAIIEVKSADVAIGSICGGGRYDNLTGVFGMEGVSGVGISFGADRIYDVMMQAGKFADIATASSEVLVVNFGGQTTQYALKIVERLRGLSVKSELYPDAVKLKKQLAYADAKKIPYIIMAGEDEAGKNAMTIKNMTSGEQELVPFENLRLYSDKYFGMK